MSVIDRLQVLRNQINAMEAEMLAGISDETHSYLVHMARRDVSNAIAVLQQTLEKYCPSEKG